MADFQEAVPTPHPTFCEILRQRLDDGLLRMLSCGRRAAFWEFVARKSKTPLDEILRAPIAQGERDRFGLHLKEIELLGKRRRLVDMDQPIADDAELCIATAHEQHMAEWAAIDEVNKYLYEISRRSAFLLPVVTLLNGLAFKSTGIGGKFICLLWLIVAIPLLFNVYLFMVRPKDKATRAFQYKETLCIMALRIFIFNVNVWAAASFSTILLACLIAENIHIWAAATFSVIFLACLFIISWNIWIVALFAIILLVCLSLVTFNVWVVIVFPFILLACLLCKP